MASLMMHAPRVSVMSSAAAPGIFDLGHSRSITTCHSPSLSSHMATPLYLVESLKRAVESVASLIISSAKISAARHFVTGSSSQNDLYSGPERIPVHYIITQA